MRFSRLNNWIKHQPAVLVWLPQFNAAGRHRHQLRPLRLFGLFSALVMTGALSACLTGCSSAYRGLQPAAGNPDCIMKFKPAFQSSLYNTQVNVVGRHLSGLLLFKQMPDSSMRIVFTSEMGAKFFDFEFKSGAEFIVHQVMSQLNKKSVINTLKNDFELILMRNLNQSEVVIRQDSVNTWYGFPRGSDTYHYVTNKTCDSLVKIEHAMKRKPKVQMIMNNYRNGIPDTIGITHRNFNFEIGLKFIDR
jgi:hypothetical protein